MPDPITVSAIVGFVFAKEAVLSKLNELRKRIVEKLKSEPEAEREINKFEHGLEPNLEAIAGYLKIAMEKDPQFAEEIHALATEIKVEIEKQGQKTNIMNVYGGKAYQQNQNQGEIYNADTINIHKKE